MATSQGNQAIATERKLRALVKHSYDNVPFCRDRFKQAGIKPQDTGELTDIRRPPIRTKDEMKAHVPSGSIASN